MLPIHFGFRLLSGAAIAFAMLAGCDLSSTAAAGGTDDTHTGIVDIQGRVLTRDARPFGNVVVRLRCRNLTDTTDSDGRFQFLSDGAPLPPASGPAVDTVDYLRDGQTIVSMPVPAWTAILPDIMLVQRDFSGTVVGDVSRVSGASCQLRLPNGTVQRIDLEWNAVQRTFGGFAYFRYQGGVDSFATVAEVRDDSDRILGRSDSVLFTSRAGDIVFPSFDADNALPIVEIRTFENSSVSWCIANCSDETQDSIDAGLRQPVRLFAEVHSNMDRFLAMEWNFDGEHWLRSSQRPAIKLGPADAPLSAGPVYDTTLTIPGTLAIGSIWPVRARALLTDGTWSEDTLYIRVVRIPPLAFAMLKCDPLRNETKVKLVAGSQTDVFLHDSGLGGAGVVSRKLYLHRAQAADTSASCLEPPRFDVHLGQTIDAPTSSCPSFFRFAPNFLASGKETGRPVSGEDTILTLPSVAGLYRLWYEVVDSDGDTTLVRSTLADLRPAAPRIDSIVVSADSIRIDWLASRPTVESQADLLATRWILKARWIASDRSDSAVVELPDASRSAVLHPPADLVTMQISLARHSAGIAGLRADSVLTALAPLRLTFSGSIQDPDRLHGMVRSRGGVRGMLAGSVGVDLRGEVAQLRWFLEDTTGDDAVAALFPLPAQRGAGRLEFDLSTDTPCRIVLLTSKDKDGSWTPGREPVLGWEVAAATKGHLVLPLDSIRWQNLSSLDEVTDLDSSDILLDIQGIAIVVESRSNAPLVAGRMELDNIAWK